MVGYYPEELWKHHARTVLSGFSAYSEANVGDREELPSNVPDSSRFMVLLGEEGRPEVLALAEAFTRSVDFHCLPIILPAENMLSNLSDHKNYWHLSCPCVMLSDIAVIRNPHYHKISDTPDTFDYQLLAQLLENMAEGLLQWL